MQRDQRDSDVIVIVKELERYLQRYPDAVDTLEGIAQWWLTQPRFQQARDTVQQALERLVAQGVIKKYITAEGKTLYSRANKA